MRDEIIARIKAGHLYKDIAAELGCCKATISYHAKREGKPRQPPKKHFDWIEVQRFHDAGNGPKACIRHFGMNSNHWYDAVRKGLVIERREHYRGECPLDDLLVENGRTKRGTLKRRLIDEGLLQNECDQCGLGTLWDGKPLVLILDHINGVHDDHRLDNLRLLCPNCNSQTDTFAGRNKKYKN